jgi:hypothetical protein
MTMEYLGRGKGERSGAAQSEIAGPGCWITPPSAQAYIPRKYTISAFICRHASLHGNRTENCLPGADGKGR